MVAPYYSKALKQISPPVPYTRYEDLTVGSVVYVLAFVGYYKMEVYQADHDRNDVRIISKDMIGGINRDMVVTVYTNPI